MSRVPDVSPAMPRKPFLAKLCFNAGIALIGFGLARMEVARTRVVRPRPEWLELAVLAWLVVKISAWRSTGACCAALFAVEASAGSRTTHVRLEAGPGGATFPAFPLWKDGALRGRYCAETALGEGERSLFWNYNRGCKTKKPAFSKSGSTARRLSNVSGWRIVLTSALGGGPKVPVA